MQSSHFTVVSFFVAIALSTVCQSAYGILSDGNLPLKWCYLCYAGFLALFMIKYYIDDIDDDCKRNDKNTSKQTSKRTLAFLSLAWVFFLLAAFSIKSLEISALSWMAGILVLNCFLHRNHSSVHHNRLLTYVNDNNALLVPLIIFAIPLASQSAKTICFVIGTMIILLCTVFPFIYLFGKKEQMQKRDKGPDQNVG